MHCLSVFHHYLTCSTEETFLNHILLILYLLICLLKSDDIDEGFADLSLDSNAKESSKEDDIQAICQQRGGGSNPSLSRQLQALDEEYRFLLDSGQSGKADYVQGLYVWKSKQATQVSLSTCKFHLKPVWASRLFNISFKCYRSSF